MTKHTAVALASLLLLVVLSLVGCEGRPATNEQTGVGEPETAQAEETLGSDADQAPGDAGSAEPEPDAPAAAESRSSSRPSVRPKPESSESTVTEAPGRETKAEVDEPPQPRIIEVTIPEGTILELELRTALDSSVSRVGDEIEARTAAPVFVQGDEVLPRGTTVEGKVTEVEASGRVKGRASLGFTFDRLSTHSGQHTIRTSYVSEEARSEKKKDAAIIGGGAGVGAIVGGIIGGKKGAAIGAAVGGAGGTGVVLTTKGEEIRLPAGTTVNVRLNEPVVVQIN